MLDYRSSRLVRVGVDLKHVKVLAKDVSCAEETARWVKLHGVEGLLVSQKVSHDPSLLLVVNVGWLVFCVDVSFCVNDGAKTRLVAVVAVLAVVSGLGVVVLVG